MIRKLHSGQYRLYSRKVDPKTGKRRNLGTFKTRQAAEKHERAVQYFKRAGPGSESHRGAVEVVVVRPLDLHRRELPDPQRPPARHVDRAVDLGRVAAAAALGRARTRPPA